MQKVLIIVGPTAIGKTSLALQLAKKFNGDILVADSRQVYRGMDVVTGKDLPINFKFKISNLKFEHKEIGYWERDGIRIWMTDLVEPTEHFSVSKWKKSAEEVLEFLQKEGKLPIIAGGTGLYVRSLTRPIETIDIPPNKKLRSKLKTRKVDELYEMLHKLDPLRAESMNLSDRKNPRRLLRAIEVANWRLEAREWKLENGSRKYDILEIGLTAPREVIYTRIDERVEERVQKGAIEEIQTLLKNRVSWDSSSMSAVGYRELRGYIEEKISFEDAISNWKQAENNYARRQLTWFKKDKDVVWFDTTNPDWQEKVEEMVENWYNKG